MNLKFVSGTTCAPFSIASQRLGETERRQAWEIAPSRCEALVHSSRLRPSHWLATVRTRASWTLVAQGKTSRTFRVILLPGRRGVDVSLARLLVRLIGCPSKLIRNAAAVLGRLRNGFDSTVSVYPSGLLFCSWSTTDTLPVPTIEAWIAATRCIGGTYPPMVRRTLSPPSATDGSAARRATAS